MSVRRRRWRDRETGALKEAWVVDVDYRLPSGETKRIRRTSPVQTRRGAEEYERQLRQSLLDGSYVKEEMPTFHQWFNGRFWKEWVVIGKKRPNKPSEKESKESIYRVHLKNEFGDKRLDEIDDRAVVEFKAKLQTKGISDKRINNILAVLSTPLRYAVKQRIIPWAPEVGLLSVEPPDIHVWEFAEYVAYMAAARQMNPMWYAAACLGGEAGLRVGEIKALDWKRDVDMVGRSITVNQQTRHGHTGTPKGRTRRTVPMTDTLFEALRDLNRIRLGFVICNKDGSAKTDNEAKNVSYRICKKAGLPLRGWHTLRHTFATDAARFGVNPWSLQHWLGHKRMDETQGYVDYAKAHSRPIPEAILKAAESETDPDKRVLKMLGARSGTLTAQQNQEQSG